MFLRNSCNSKYKSYFACLLCFTPTLWGMPVFTVIISNLSIHRVMIRGDYTTPETWIGKECKLEWQVCHLLKSCKMQTFPAQWWCSVSFRSIFTTFVCSASINSSWVYCGCPCVQIPHICKKLFLLPWGGSD